MVFGIVTNHEGFIELISEPAHGSTFNMYFPLRQQAPQDSDTVRHELEPRRDENLSRGGETILFVEDEPIQLRLMQNFLQSEGYRVLIAREGNEAINVHLAHKDEIALVILDLGLPKLNGWEIFQRMKNANPELKAIIASGYITAELESAMAQGELKGVIMKPYELNDVAAPLNS